MANAFGALRSAWGLSEWPGTSGPLYNNFALDASNDGIAFVFQPESVLPITHAWVRYGVRTGTPPEYAVTMEELDANGYPTGTDIGGASPTRATFTPPADATWDGTGRWIALTNPYTPVLPYGADSAQHCYTIRHSSGTVDASNFSTFTTSTSASPVTGGLEYPLRMTAGSWAKQFTNLPYGIRTATTRQGWPSEVWWATRTTTVGHRQAMKFSLDSGSGSTFRIRGFRFLGSMAATSFGKTPIAGIWDASGLLQGVSVHSSRAASPASTGRNNIIMFDPSTLATLNNGTDYYIGLEVVDAVSGGVVIHGTQCGEANDLLAFPGGTEYRLATFDGSVWTEVPTVRPYLEIMMDDITATSGGGGMLLMGGLGQTGIGVF